MAALTFLACLFSAGTSCIIIGAALPEWYREEYNQLSGSFIAGNPWRTCWFEPGPNAVEQCAYRNAAHGHRDNKDQLYARVIMGLMAACLGVSLLASLTLIAWVLSRNKSSSRCAVGLLTAALTLISSLLAVATVVVFHKTLYDFTHKNSEKLPPFWLVVAGAIGQGVMAFASFLHLAIESSRKKSYFENADVYINSAYKPY